MNATPPVAPMPPADQAPDAPANVPQRRRNRTMLVALAVIFFGSMAIAGALRFSGWQPAGMKNKGEMLQPYGDLRALQPTLQDGSRYAWNPVARKWRVLVAPPAGCSTDCVEIARELDLVWQLLGKDADQVDILWLGAPPEGAVRNAATRIVQPDAALRAAIPRVDMRDGKGTAPPVYVVDPNGFVILRYAPGFDAGDLRSDLSRLLKLM